MFNILIITHGELCEELDSAVKFILGEKMLREIFTVTIDKDTRDFDTYASRISNFITEERKTIITKMLKIQKEFMELERKDGITEKDIHHNPTGIVKEYKEEHEKLANRLVDIAHKLKGSIRT